MIFFRNFLEKNYIWHFNVMIGDPFRCVALAWPAALQLCAFDWSVDLPSFLALFGWSRTCKCSPLFACIGQLSKCGVYLLSSRLSAVVKLFTNCKGTTVSYFFVTLSTYIFITLEISCSFTLLC